MTSRGKPLPTKIKRLLYATLSAVLVHRRDRDPRSRIEDRRMPLPATAFMGSEFRPRRSDNGRDACLGVVIHAFYPDVFSDIIEHLDGLSSKLHLYVTTPPESKDAVAASLASSPHPYTLLVCENRGKDILPFLKVAPLLIENGHDLFLKVHTKKSPHRRWGFFWRVDIYAKLMHPKAVAEALEAFRRNPTIGIIAPEDHLVPMTHYSRSIQGRIIQLAERVGVSKDVTLGLRFAAGTMFFARTECVQPLLALSLGDEDFESEDGQIDGTMAHAMERLFAVAAEAVSMNVVDTRFSRRVAGGETPG